MSIVTAASTVRVWAEVRCDRCRRLLLKWSPSGVSNIEVKCPRCGRIEALHLSTG